MTITIQASTRATDGPLLQLEDVRTHFQTARGVVRAVDGVSLTLERGRALGIGPPGGTWPSREGVGVGVRGRARVRVRAGPSRPAEVASDGSDSNK